MKSLYLPTKSITFLTALNSSRKSQSATFEIKLAREYCAAWILYQKNFL